MKNKILYFGMSGNLGGIESHIKNYYQAFTKRNIDIDFIKMEDSICFEEDFINGGSKVTRLPNRRSNPIRFIVSLYTFLKKHPEYKIIHVHLNTCSSIEPILISKLLKRVVFIHSHSEWKGTNMVTRIIHYINRPVAYWLSDEKLACSVAAGKWLFGNKNFRTMKNAIDLKEYRYNIESRKKMREELGIKGKYVIGHIGRFSHVKNHEFLIKVFCKVNKKYQNSSLILVGDGELRQKCERLINEMNLNESVIFTGVRNDIPSLLSSMDVFVFPSHYEGLGMVVIEAQASGLPCIASKYVPREVNLTNMVEFLPIDDSEDVWVDKIIKHVNNKRREDTHNLIRENGYDIETAAGKLEEIYKSYIY